MSDDARRSDDGGSPGDELAAEAGRLRLEAEQLQAVIAAADGGRHDLISPDGRTRVVLDGRPRITELSLPADFSRLLPGEAGAVLTDLINQGLEQARTARAAAIGQALPPRWQGLIR